MYLQTAPVKAPQHAQVAQHGHAGQQGQHAGEQDGGRRKADVLEGQGAADAADEKAADQGDASAQYNLGLMYYHGEGVKQDYLKAKELWEKAAVKGNAEAKNNIGVLYKQGNGVKQDYKKAKEWYGKACDGGHQLGCDNYKRLNQQGY